MTRMWMVRGEGGTLYDAFREHGVVAVGWDQLAAHAKLGVERERLIELYESARPQAKRGTAVSSASQVWRFVNEIQDGDWIVTYSPLNRVYLVGKVAGPAEHHPEWQGMSLARKVQWQKQELPRDRLSASTKNSLGATLTVFEVPSSAATDVLEALKGKPPLEGKPRTEDLADDPLANIDIEFQARERIEDLIIKLDWKDMQKLIAGILRALNYKTKISPDGPDRGKDIVASPDSLGFQLPRILVEVKHRKEQQMGTKEIRGFTSVLRHNDDRGLYVSTGGFTKEARYEAERAPKLIELWTLDDVVRALIDHYDKTDAETKSLVPLKRLYWPNLD